MGPDFDGHGHFGGPHGHGPGGFLPWFGVLPLLASLLVALWVSGYGAVAIAWLTSFLGPDPWRARWADAVALIMDPLDRNPLLARLEENRVLHIAQEHSLRVALWSAQARQVREEAVLARMLESSAFSVAERLSQLRARAGVAPGQSVISREQIRRAMNGPADR